MCRVRENRMWQSDTGKRGEKRKQRERKKSSKEREKERGENVTMWQEKMKGEKKKARVRERDRKKECEEELCRCVRARVPVSVCARAITCQRGSVMSPATQLNSRAGWWRWDGGPGIQPVSSKAFNSAALQPAVSLSRSTHTPTDTHTHHFLSLTHSCTHWETLRLFVSFFLRMYVCTGTYVQNYACTPTDTHAVTHIQSHCRAWDWQKYTQACKRHTLHTSVLRMDTQGYG